MTSNRDHVNTLITDIRDCAKRASTLGYFQRGGALEQIATDLEQMHTSTKRNSVLPPGHANQKTRATASEHFQATQRILKDIIK